MTHAENIAHLQTKTVNGYIDDLINTAQQQVVAKETELATLREQLTEAHAERDATVGELTTRIRELETQLAPPNPANLPYWGTPWFEDNFTGNSIDPTKWNVRARDDLGLLNDVAIPARENITVENGICHIRAKWLPTPVTRTDGKGVSPTLTHTTGYMDHRVLKPGNVKHEQVFGRWEIRAKMPTGPNTLGSLAAFWLRNTGSREIDITEGWGYGTKPLPNGQRDGTTTTTFHSNTMGGGTKLAYTLEEELKRKNITVTKAYEDFHDWAFEFTPDYAATYIDGHEAFRITPTQDAGKHAWIWAQLTPNHVRINLHVGPSIAYYGLPKPGLTVDPLDFQIEHVRIWAMPE